MTAIALAPLAVAFPGRDAIGAGESRVDCIVLHARRLTCWMFAVFLLGAALGGVSASASVGFDRTDVTVPGAPDSIALGDLDGRNGLDIPIALPGLGSVGVMLNNGDGTFAAI